MEVDHASTWTLENLAQVPGVKSPEAVIIGQSCVSDSKQLIKDLVPIFSESKKNTLGDKEVSADRL